MPRGVRQFPPQNQQALCKRWIRKRCSLVKHSSLGQPREWDLPASRPIQRAALPERAGQGLRARPHWREMVQSFLIRPQ